MSDAARPITTAHERIRSEYLEMPDMSLTLDQVSRLCGVERVICMRVLDALVDLKFLARNAEGAYARVTDNRAIRIATAGVRDYARARLRRRMN